MLIQLKALSVRYLGIVRKIGFLPECGWLGAYEKERFRSRDS